jgi:transketolase
MLDRDQNKKMMTKEAWLLRKEIVATLHATGGGHYGGALSVLDILLALYTKVASIHPGNDRIILSKGHSAVALYCVLAHLGLVDRSSLKRYGKFQSGLEGHPDMHVTPGVDFSSGSLGQGLSVALGMAIGLKNKADMWVVLGDGECQEGQIWEAALLAARYKVDNLHVIVDANNAQEFGYKLRPELEQVPIPQMQEKWKAFGWHVEVCSGHNLRDLERSLQTLKTIKDKPSVLIANTKKGFGIPLFESDPEKFHCIDLSPQQYASVMEELEEICNN